jgi:hypothetical protein
MPLRLVLLCDTAGLFLIDRRCSSKTLIRIDVLVLFRAGRPRHRTTSAPCPSKSVRAL